ncbi:MAG TPA: AAA family ATPase [Steroidobacteraceae bacterium]|nr:AAA family ATPase [Steroidobacteraceae bacterium]
MSIVERALKRLQDSAQAGAKPPRAPLPPVGRVVPAVTVPGPASHESQPRREIGNTAKSVHIDFDALRLRGLLPPEHQQRQLSHQYRMLKRPLLKAAFDEVTAAGVTSGASPRTIMVTSALPGEGKTFTTINLALSLALEKDHRVILIDGDAPKPHVSHTFGVASEPGLIDVLTNPDIPVESVILPTDIAGLYIVPIGQRSGSTTELLSSARMRQVVAELQALDDYGIVLFDSPPILLTSEAQVLASLFGQIVLVVRAGVTPQQAVTDALGMIGEGPRIGLVLNQALHDNNVGGYYGYGYGDGFVESQQAGQHES